MGTLGPITGPTQSLTHSLISRLLMRRTVLSHVSMLCMQSAILLWQIRLSATLLYCIETNAQYRQTLSAVW